MMFLEICTYEIQQHKYDTMFWYLFWFNTAFLVTDMVSGQ